MSTPSWVTSQQKLRGTLVTGRRKSLAEVIASSPVRGADYPERGGQAAYAAFRANNACLPAWAELGTAQQEAWVDIARQAYWGWTGA